MTKHLWSVGGAVHILIIVVQVILVAHYLNSGSLWLAALWAVAAGCWVNATRAYLQYKVADEKLRSTLERLGL